MKIKNTKKLRTCKSKDYNYIFNKNNGNFARWGKTFNDDPQIAPCNEILDCEVTTICQGVLTRVKSIDKNGETCWKIGKKVPCSFCYKSNTPKGKNMSFKTFKTIIDKMPWTLQVAFGVDSECTSNPDIWKMMAYCRKKDIVPNVTVANISDETADKLAKYCGAVSVSRYFDKDTCYDSVKKLTDRGMNQINIHSLTSEETYDLVLETLKDRLTDKRLEKLHAIVMLNLKQRGRGEAYNMLSEAKFKVLVDFAFKNNIVIGFDSCGCGKFLNAVKDYPNYKNLEVMSEKCESSLFSAFIDVDGLFYPCSFCGGKKSKGDWVKGLNVVKCKDFISDIWENEKTIKFRETLLKNDRNCPLYDV